MKKTYEIFLFIFWPLFLAAAPSPGLQYRIASAASVDKSVWVDDASRANNAAILLWTETEVPAQRWTFEQHADRSYTIRNVYTGKVLYRKGHALEASAIYQSDNVAAQAAKWELQPAAGRPGHYYITQPHKDGGADLYLEATSTKDGAALSLHLQKTGDDAKRQLWKIEASEVDTDYSAAMRDRIMLAWKNKYYKKAYVGYVLGSGGWWEDAEMFEIILDAYETTGEPVYETMFRELYRNFVQRKGKSWLYNNFNDDIAWMVIASVRAHLLFGDADFLSNGQSNFDKMYARALLPSGMLRWKETAKTKYGTNSCINGPAGVAACYLAMALGDDAYYEKAKNLYALQRKYLYVPATGRVYDSFSWLGEQPSDYNYWSSTYNQGSFLGAAVMLYNRYGSLMYKEDAEKIMAYTLRELCDEYGIVKVCQTGHGDLSGFKGILMRYVRRFIVDMQKTEYVDWMRKNTLHAYNNRNSAGVISSAWLAKSPESFVLDDCKENCSFKNFPFGPSTAVSVAFNTPRDADRIVKDAFTNIEVQHFNYLKGVYIQPVSAASSYQASHIRDGFYLGYSNVDFGNHLASEIEISLSGIAARSSIELRSGGPKGDLLAQIPVTETGDGERLLRAPIRPTSGMKNIYLVFKGPTDKQQLFRLNFFRFKTQHPLYPDISDNGGRLSAGFDSETLAYATDNSLTTTLLIPAQSNSYLQYQSPVPVALRAYAIFSDGKPDKAPASWTLRASKDGEHWVDLDTREHQTFSAPYEKKSPAIMPDDAYTFFRLNLQTGSEVRLSEWQLYGEALFKDDITADGGNLSVVHDGEPNTDYRILTDKKSATVFRVKADSGLRILYKAQGGYKLEAYSLTAAGDAPEKDPRSWVLYASSDGKDWVKIDEQRNQAFDYRKTTQYYRVCPDKAYQYYKLQMKANAASSEVQLAEWQLLGELFEEHLYEDITRDGGELTASDGQSSEFIRMLTDNKVDTKYVLAASVLPVWIQYKSAIPAKLLAYSLAAGYDNSKDPKNWLLQASNDGKDWINIQSRSNISFSQKAALKTYAVNASLPYSYFRLTVNRLSDAASDRCVLGEWEIHATAISQHDITANGGSLKAELAVFNPSEDVSKLSDKTERTKYCNHFYASSWVQYESPLPVAPTAYSITSANDDPTRDPRSWILEATADGQHWEKIDERRNQEFPYRALTQFYSCNASRKKYKAFRLNIIENNGANLMQFSEWQLFERNHEQTKLSSEIKRETLLLYYDTRCEALQLNLPEPAALRIFNLSGQPVYQVFIAEGRQSLPVTNLSEGMYLVNLLFSNRVVTKRILFW